MMLNVSTYLHKRGLNLRIISDFFVDKRNQNKQTLPERQKFEEQKSQH